MLLRKKKKRIYADAAAATPLSAQSRAELMRLLDVYGNAGALHKEAVEAKRELDHARAAIAQAIGAHGDEIIFTASGTEGNNIAIDGTLRPLLREGAGVHAITLAIEHQSVLEPLRALAKDGLSLTELPVDESGAVSLEELEKAITDKTAFISIQLVNSEVGAIQPIHDIAKAVRNVRKTRAPEALPLLFHCDASQAPLWLPLKTEKLGIDLMTLDAQKVEGPKGIGALYIRRRTAVEPVIRGGVQERGLRAGTPNVPLAGAFAAAMREAAEGAEERAANIAAIRNYLFEQLQKRIPDVILNGPALEDRVANNLNISVPGLDGEMAVLGMDALGVSVSTRSACNTGDEEPSHVIKALGVPKERSKTAVRITLLPGATRAEANVIADAFQEIAQRYKIVV